MKFIRLLTKYSFASALLLGLLTTAWAAPEGLAASAKISGCEGDTVDTVSGRAELREHPSTEGIKVVDVKVLVSGLPDGKHAVHVHETGNCGPCSAANGHFDPGPAGLSSPDGNHPYHAGDLVNIEVKNGSGTLEITTTRISLSPGPLSIFDEDGSALIIHVDPDTYCPNGEVKGCAGGGRAACGIITQVK
jgi:Cu/Zn superoxide dismutase